LLREQLKRFWYLALVQMALYGIILLTVYSDAISGPRQMLNVLQMSHIIIPMAMLFFPFFAVSAMFTYLFRVQSADVTHSLPYTRTQLFCTNVLTGLILMIVPLLLFCVFCLNPVYMPGSLGRIGTPLNPFGDIALFFGRMLLALVFYYAVYLVCVMASGNIIMFIVAGGALPFLPITLHIVWQFLKSFFLTGYDVSSHLNAGLAEKLFISNPIFMMFQIQGGIDMNPYIITYGITALVLCVLAFFLYRLRRLERAGETLVFTPAKNALVFFLASAVSAALTFTAIALLAEFAGIYIANDFAILLLFALFFVVFYYLGHMMMERTIHVKSKRKLLKWFAAVLGGILVVGYFFTITGIGSSFVPKFSDVEAVYTGGASFNNIPDGTIISDSNIIDGVINAHKALLKDKGTLREAGFYGGFNSSGLSRKYGHLSREYIAYFLTDGAAVTSAYVIPASLYESSGLNSLHAEETVALTQYLGNKARLEPEDLGAISLSIPGRFDGSLGFSDPRELEELFACIKADALTDAERMGAMIKEAAENGAAAISDYYGADNICIINIFSKEEMEEISSGDYYYSRPMDIRLADPENILAWLKENGINY
jgi:hypothetical protein